MLKKYVNIKVSVRYYVDNSIFQKGVLLLQKLLSSHLNSGAERARQKCEGVRVFEPSSCML